MKSIMETVTSLQHSGLLINRTIEIEPNNKRVDFLVDYYVH